MAMVDRELLAEYLERVRDKHYGFEIIEILEQADLITVDDVIAQFEDQIIEGRKLLDKN